MGRVQKKAGLDRLALFLSGLCLIHCLALPFALLLGPVLSGWLLETETTVHWFLWAMALPISALALSRGTRRHGRTSILWLGGLGLVMMFAGVSHILGDEAEIALTVIGVLALLTAHLINLSATHSLSHPPNHANDQQAADTHA